MALTETQYPGWRLHRRRGEAHKYYNGIAASSLPQAWTGSSPALNFAPALPAGTFVDINGQLYVTRNALQSGQWGEIDPLNWHPSYIMPKKSTDTFVDRAAVYWDETNCYATSTSSGNKFIGYAVINGELATGTTTSGSTLVTGTVTQTGLDSQTKSYTVTSGSSADGQYKNYGSGDTYMEVEVVYSNTVTVSGTTGPFGTLAATGSAIGNAAALPAGATLVSGGNNAVGVILTAGQGAKVKNTGAGGLFVYPPVGGTINALSANSSLNMATLTVAEFIPSAANSLIFYTFPLLPS